VGPSVTARTLETAAKLDKLRIDNPVMYEAVIAIINANQGDDS
jgi:hypothetical protein